MPILFHRGILEALDSYIKFREEAGIGPKNIYLFANLSGKSYIDLSPVIQCWSQKCGAEFPHLPTCTKLRKHVATIGLALNLTHGQIGDLSDFMGHDRSIHSRVYRQNIASKEIDNIAKLLEYAEGENNTAVADESEDEDMENKRQRVSFQTPNQKIRREKSKEIKTVKREKS